METNARSTTRQPDCVEGELARLAAEQHGVFLRHQALDCGYRDTEIAARVRERDWVRVRRGAFADGAVWEASDASGRHALLVRAVVARLDGVVIVGGYSSLAVQGVPTWGVDLGKVHVYRDESRSSRTDAKVVHHEGPIPDEDVVFSEGLWVCKPERSVIDSARTVPFEAAVVLADGAQRQLAYSAERAEIVFESQRDWPGSLAANRVIAFADGHAETVGESRSRVMFARIGLPTPSLQHRIFRADGSEIARTDFWIEEHSTVGEFDGKQKYGRAFYERTGRLEKVDLEEVLWAEKRREDEIRGEGNEVVRWVWSELDGHDRVINQRFQSAFDRAGRRSRYAS